MDKLILISPNITGLKKQANGRFNFFQKLKDLHVYDNIYLDADIPDVEIFLDWEEYYTPVFNKEPFMPLISPKLYEFPFQYFGVFNKSEKLNNRQIDNFSEKFEAKLGSEVIFKSSASESVSFNCSWIMEFFAKAEKINSDLLRNDILIWQKTDQGYEIVLEALENNRKLLERQIISFSYDFESVSWQHLISIK